MAEMMKFVDLVRNFTEVEGTEPVPLGAVPEGFSGFAESCQTGDNFFYSIVAADADAIELGRGVLLADGMISRAPLLGGALVDFAPGKKVISLVAPTDLDGERQDVATPAWLDAEESAPPATVVEDRTLTLLEGIKRHYDEGSEVRALVDELVEDLRAGAVRDEVAEDARALLEAVGSDSTVGRLVRDALGRFGLTWHG